MSAPVVEQIKRCELEQGEGPPLVPPVDPRGVDDRRRQTYESYEQFLRAQLVQLDRDRPSLWHRDYSSLDRYMASVESMRRHLKEMLGFWDEPETRPAILPRNHE